MSNIKTNSILTKMFFDLVPDKTVVNYRISDLQALEQSLEKYIETVFGKSIMTTFEEHYREIAKAIENIINDMRFQTDSDIVKFVQEYSSEYNNLRYKYPHVSIFINIMKKIYSRGYNGTIGQGYREDYDPADTYIILKNYLSFKSIVIGRYPRKEEIELPQICIQNLENFENTLKNYVETVKQSNSFYNLFQILNYSTSIEYDRLVGMLLESTIFNATIHDALDIENFFAKYTDFVSNKEFQNITRPSYMGELFQDDLYVMAKRSELEYETPYYLCFMLKNLRVELPNVRLGIEEKDSKKIAHIITTQSAQKVLDLENAKYVEDEIKNHLPTSSQFRYYNPSHLVSLLLTFSLLKGMGIHEVEIVDYMPFRTKKTSLDKHMNEEERDSYQTRLTNKNIITYMRLLESTENIKIVTYPENDVPFELNLEEDFTGKNEFLNHIIKIGIASGEQYKVENTYHDKR